MENIVIVGAGQAGLALSQQLKQRKVPHLVLEAHARIGDNWRTRWDSLHLFSPARYNSLPDLPFPGTKWSLPSKDQAADYLEGYARHFDLPVRVNSKVGSVQARDQGFVLKTSQGELHTRRLVLATGAYGTPRIPNLSSPIPDSLVQIHSTQYRNPAQLPAVPTLVVGAGASGQQIARELVATRPVVLAGPDVPNLPRRWLGIDIYWWLYKSGLIRKVVPPGKRAARASGPEVTVAESYRTLMAAGVRRVGKVLAFEGHKACFENEGFADVEALVWATGYQNTYPWIELDMLDAEGRPAHVRGISNKVEGLYFIGLPYLHRVNSSLMGGVGADASFLARVLAG